MFKSLPFIASSFFFLPALARAQWVGVIGVFDFLIDAVATIVPLLVAIAVLVFFWGILKFIAHADDERAREEGKHVMIWGMVALFVMVSLWAIVGYLQESLGLVTWGGLGNLPTVPSTIPIP